MEKDNMYTLKRMLTFLMIVIMIGSLTGCGETVPDLTKEQETAISEYAVELITKHSKESDGRKQLLDEEMEDTFFEEGHFQESQDVTEESDVPGSENVEEAEPALEDTVNATDSADNSDGVETEEPVYSDRTMAQIFGISNVDITFNGYEVMETYAPDSNSYFSLTATRGKKFVVLYFNISNLTNQVAGIDLNALDVKYSFGDANGKKKKLEHTMTAKDIYSYVGELEPGQTDTLVGLVEMVESDIELIETPVLSIQFGDSVDVLLLE